MFNLPKALRKHIKIEEIAKMLKTTPEALEKFEQMYSTLLEEEGMSDNLFDINAKQAASENAGVSGYDERTRDIVDRIVKELVDETPVCIYDENGLHFKDAPLLLPGPLVTDKEVLALSENERPSLTGYYAKRDIGEPSYIAILDTYRRFLKEKNPDKKKVWYNHFRQGLDILDLDEITYQIIGTNQNSMGHWLPQIVKAAESGGFFKIPKTRIIKVPLTMLQLTRQEYTALSRTTLDIVDSFCREVFDLDEEKSYFIKTGTYSSKYDFRNACVKGEKEVRELGEYLLFIHYQACMMASPFTKPASIYGVSTTNEWVVREFIEDKENNPCIYKGLPLHTEYRVFVDFDSKEILGINPYWDPDVMKNRFKSAGPGSPHDMHDYAIYSMHEETLMCRYNKNKHKVLENIQTLLNDMADVDVDGHHIPALTGQWSIDVMQNGDDFWIIDMALAQMSALKECVPVEKLKPMREDWIPKLVEKGEK